MQSVSGRVGPMKCLSLFSMTFLSSSLYAKALFLACLAKIARNVDRSRVQAVHSVAAMQEADRGVLYMSANSPKPLPMPHAPTLPLEST